MPSFTEKSSYREDIDGLRAIAVVVVILFHFGHLEHGYLGVDIFFVISGYLITKILYIKSLEDNFSILDFYQRRIRRIIPLVTFICIVALIIGYIVMLPDDLENLAQSIIATTFFSNNILQYLTTHDYWAIANEYRPLMHSWSLAIEEQYYLLYPFIFLFFSKQRIKYILPLLILLTIGSLGLYFAPFDEASKFYLLPFRFYELSIGGVVAVVFKNKLIDTNWRIIVLMSIFILLLFRIPGVNSLVLNPIVVLLTAILLVTHSKVNSITSFILENKVMIGLGKISFSLYMWHQLILAFTRYTYQQDPSFLTLVIVSVCTVVLSILTYYFIEQPFRKKKFISIGKVLVILSCAIGILLVCSGLIYRVSGAVRDVPEYNIEKGKMLKDAPRLYNEAIRKRNKPFSNDDRTKILVIGNSYARDWSNVLLESKYGSTLEISYVEKVENQLDLSDKFELADIIFYSVKQKSDLTHLSDSILQKVWCVGTKNFGQNNGVYYNNKGDDYCLQRTILSQKVISLNTDLKNQWQWKYVDLIGILIDSESSVPIFTDDCRFISHDGSHFTEAGAQYFSQIFELTIENIIKT